MSCFYSCLLSLERYALVRNNKLRKVTLRCKDLSFGEEIFYACSALFVKTLKDNNVFFVEFLNDPYNKYLTPGSVPLTGNIKAEIIMQFL